MRIIRRLKHLTGRQEHDLHEEMETHRLMTEQRLRAEGMSAAAAAAHSRRLMGNVTLAQEDAREAWLAPWLGSVWQDLRYAVRHLVAHPAFTLTAVGTLVLATALNTSFFTVFNATMLRPWPVADPDRTVLLNARMTEDGSQSGFQRSDFAYLREQAKSFTGLVALGGGGGRVGAAPGPDVHYVQTGYVSASFFDVLGVPMAVGRGFLEQEDTLASPADVVIIGAGLWERAFGRDPQILGRTIYVGNVPMTVVGVTAPGIGGNWPFRFELWLPMATATIRRSLGPCCVTVAGVIRPGVTRDAARSELSVLMRQLDEAAQRKPRTVLVTGTRMIELPDAGRRAAPFILFLGALIVVLLLACANIGNLQLARALARRRELAIRLSLGAGRWRIVRQLLTETLLVSAVAGSIAIGASFVLPDAVFRAMDQRQLVPLTPDRTVLAFGLFLCVLTTVATGLAPALRGTRDAADFTTAQRGAFGGQRPLLRAVLLPRKIALSATLLFGASILTRGLVHASSADPGYDITGVTVATVTLPSGAYDGPRSSFFSELTGALQSSGLGPVGAASPLPLEPSSLVIDVRRPQDAADDMRTVHLRPLSAATFDVLGIPLAAGRIYSDDARNEVVVNEAFARAFWPDGTAVGQRLQGRTTYDVVGVVRDVHVTDLGAIAPVLHHPGLLTGVPPLLLKTRPGDLAAQLRSVLQQLEPRASVAIVPLANTVRQSLQASYTTVTMTWLLGALALILATVGVFGVFSYIVEERAREIAIRMALGARRSQVLGLVFRATRTSVLAGLAIALVLSVVTGQLLRAFLFGLSPLDPVAFLGAAALLVMAAVVATAIPIRRATRVDPVAALRME